MDLSRTVFELKDDLMKAKAEFEQDQDLSPFQLDTSTMSRDDAEKVIMGCLNGKGYTKAVHYMRNLRY